MRDDGVDIMKDGAPAFMTSSGLGMMITPILVIQVIGCIVGVLGIFFGYRRNKIANMQAQETKRANDLKQEQWEYELANGKAKEKAACSGEEKER